MDGEDKYPGAGARRLRRGGRVGGVVAKHGLRSMTTSLAAPMRSSQATSDARDADILRLADDLVVAFGGMRGAAQKLGQLLGILDLGIASERTRVEFARRVGRLYSSGPSFDDSRMFAVLDKELGGRRGRIVEIVERVASASIGQVYRARLDDGRDVAVKIKYPDIDRMVRADMKNMTLFVRLMTKHLPAQNASEIADEIERQILAELDFAQELVNQSAFFDRFAGHPGWRVPEPIADLCTDRVLVSEFLEGQKFDEIVDSPQATRDAAGEAIYRFYCGEIYRSGQFCGDPHPGNILLLDDGRIGFVDFGLCLAMSEKDHAVERNVFLALLQGDEDAVYAQVKDAGFISSPEQMGREELLLYMRAVVGWHLGEGELTVTDFVARRAVADAVLPGADLGDKLRQQVLVESHAFARRNELTVCALLGRLEASRPWGEIARENLGIGVPATALGRRIADWQRVNR